MLLAAFLLGLTGSVSHCVGMCSGVALMLGRAGVAAGPRLLLLHAGRVSSYTLLGALAGGLGHLAARLIGGGHHGGATPFAYAQGAVALGASAVALYMGLAQLGRVRSPELLMVGVTRRWGRAMRSLKPPAGAGLLPPYLYGLLWGFLPCGMVLTALLAAAATRSPWWGAAAMLAFGAGTLPALLGVNRLARLAEGRAAFRYGAALVVLLFSAQLALRGFAAWGWVAHMHLGSVLLW